MIRVSRAESTNYSAAAPVTFTVTVTQAQGTITGSCLSGAAGSFNVEYNSSAESPCVLGGTGDNPLAATLASTLSSGVLASNITPENRLRVLLSGVSLGSYMIRVSRAESTNYSAATSAFFTVEVVPARQEAFAISLSANSMGVCLAPSDSSSAVDSRCSISGQFPASLSGLVFNVSGGTMCTATFSSASTVSGDAPSWNAMDSTLSVTSFGLSYATMPQKDITLTKNCGANYQAHTHTLRIILSVDVDADGLIEIYTIEQLNNMRHDPTGSSYTEIGSASTSSSASLTEAPSCDDSNPSTTRILCGYELARDLDFNQALHYESASIDMSLRPNNNVLNLATNAGWAPIGNFISRFTAVFEGNGYSISNLYVNKASEYAGLFGYTTRSIRNIGIKQAYVKTSRDLAGGLVGSAGGPISSSYVTGSVRGDWSVGGLVGQLRSTNISSSYATASVHGTGRNIGGLVGEATSGDIIASYATGYVSGDDGSAGGLVGEARNMHIISSYATATVYGAAGVNIGGLVAWARNITLTSSYATGEAQGITTVGGLIAYIAGTNNTLTSSYATGAVQGTTTGRLIGGRDTNAATLPSIGHSCGALDLDHLRTHIADSSFTYTASDNITCNAEGNTNTPVSGIQLFREWDHHYYRRTGSAEPYTYTLVMEGDTGCANSSNSTSCASGGRYPGRGSNDIALWNLGSASATAHNSLPVLQPPPNPSTHALDPHLQWAQHFVAGWRLQNGATNISTSTTINTNSTLSLAYSEGLIPDAAYAYNSDGVAGNDNYRITVNWDTITGDAGQTGGYSVPSNDMGGFLRYDATSTSTNLSIVTANSNSGTHNVFLRAILELSRGSGLTKTVHHSYNRDFNFRVTASP